MNSNEGWVFDIQRFSIHDGPGIRTTVFLKGCSLQCTWCSNPESQKTLPELGYDLEKCTHCMACVAVDKTGTVTNNNGTLQINRERFSYREAGFVEACPTGALKVYGKTMHVKEVLDIVKKDKVYYSNSDGGLTLSGGEPLKQIDFAYNLLSGARNEDIPTAVETCGCVPEDNIKKIKPLVDIFLFDYKIYEPIMHKKHTGVSNERIINNLKWLSNNHKHIILRCPIIPGINDTTEHFKAIAQIKEENPSVKEVQVMPYHTFGRGKYTMLQKSYKLDKTSVSRDQAQEWVEEIKNLGVQNTLIG